MNNNVGIQNFGSIAWDGAAATLADISNTQRFGWCFTVTADIAVAAVFKVVSAPASAGNPCVPGASEDVMVKPICSEPGAAPTLGTFVIPAGTKAGAECSGTIPCFPNKFVGLAAVSGDTDSVLAVLVRHGSSKPN